MTDEFTIDFIAASASSDSGAPPDVGYEIKAEPTMDPDTGANSGFGGQFADGVNFGGYNGAFANGPPDPTQNLTPATSTSSSNFMPNWRFVQSSNTNITAKQVRDTASPSGSNIRFTATAGSANDAAFIEQIVNIGGSRAKWYGHVIYTSWLKFASTSDLFKVTLEGVYLSADLVPLFGDSASAVITAGRLQWHVAFGPFETLPTNARYLRIRLGLIRDTAPTGATCTVDFTDIHMDRALVNVLVADVTNADNYMGKITQDNGVMTILPGDAGLGEGGSVIIDGQLGDVTLKVRHGKAYVDSSALGLGVDEILTTATGAPNSVNYLVGTASASLTSEIAVGTTPGGELGGTWASPTVDATHSGSAHVLLTSNTPAAVSTTGAVGTGTASAKDDHVHAHEAAHINHDTTWAAKGDLIAGTANDTAAVVTVGANDTILMADSAQTTGLKWVAPATPVATGVSNAVGSADTFTRGDHVHQHAYLGAAVVFADDACPGTGTVTITPASQSTLGLGSARVAMPLAGSVVGISIFVGTARSAGTLTAQCNFNLAGVIGPIAQIDGTTTNSGNASSAIGTATFNAGDSLRVNIVGSSFTPTANAINVLVLLAFNAP